MTTHTHGWPDEHPDWRRRNYPLLVPSKPPRSLARSVVRWLLYVLAWAAIWIVAAFTIGRPTDLIWFVPLWLASVLGYVMRSTE